jgi:post-segregation antitoxin (ccd killing protein)
LRSKAASVRALVEVSSQAQTTMQEALAASQTERAQHEFRKVAVALSKVRQFVAEAEACLGKAGATPGTTEVTMTEENAAAVTDETSDWAWDALDIGDAPPDVSPFD